MKQRGMCGVVEGIPHNTLHILASTNDKFGAYMSKHQFSFPLTLKKDIKGEEYMIGSTDFPGSVDLRETTFIVFFPEEGEEFGTLMIRPRTLVPRAVPSENKVWDKE